MTYSTLHCNESPWDIEAAHRNLILLQAAKMQTSMYSGEVRQYLNDEIEKVWKNINQIDQIEVWLKW